MILVVNLGLKSIRCIAFDEAGTVLARSSYPIHTQVSNEFVEQDPREWRDLMYRVVGDVVGELGSAVAAVSHLTVTTSASCLVAIDDRGTPLRPSILVSDTRSTRQVEQLHATPEFAAVAAETGLRPSPDLMLPKMMWMRKHEPELAHRTHCYLGAGDYLVWLLTGELVTDPSNALKFHYRLGEDRYPDELLDALGFHVGQLPRVLPMGSDIGRVLPAVAADLGLPKATRVVLTTYDALAAVTGTGAFVPGDAADVSGTVTSFRAVAASRPSDPDGRIYISPHLDGSWLVGGSNNLGGGTIEWLRQLFFADEADPYATIEAEAAAQPPCPGGLIFLPYLLGERAPIWNPSCRGVFFGLNRAHGRPQMVRAVLESVALSVRDIAGVLADLGVAIERVTVSGGLARLDTANQIKADVLGIPVRRLADFETTSIGAAIIAMHGVGLIDDPRAAFDRFSTVDRVYEPDDVNHAVYDEYFALYREVYRSLVPAFDHRRELLERLQSFGIDELVMTENL